jgi:predicted polyphosphate/ATP-dependent NAD kinase
MSQRVTVGLIVNPIAGMGGSVGLKGTDGGLAEKARRLGAEPVTPSRTCTFLEHVQRRDAIRWLAAPGPMGAAHLADAGFEAKALGSIEGRDAASTSAADTWSVARTMLDQGVDLLVFVGGDGTARDILDAVGTQVPVVGVPAGVKVYSAAFAVSPRAAAAMVDAFVDGADVTEMEVLDIDEDAFRADRLESTHYGFLLVPDAQAYLQPGKEGSTSTANAAENKRDIAADVVESMDAETLYLLGPGTTVRAVAEALNVPKTLLGIDAVKDGARVGADLNEAAILDLLDRASRCEIIVTPLGGNGFLFGRGNKPFTPAVLRRVGLDADRDAGGQAVRVIATQRKIREVDVLRVDTGDPEVDRRLSGYMEVTVGYHFVKVVRVEAV